MTVLFEENQGILEIMLDGLADGILVVDRTGNILFANRAVKDLFDLSRDPVGRAPGYCPTNNVGSLQSTGRKYKASSYGSESM